MNNYDMTSLDRDVPNELLKSYGDYGENFKRLVEYSRIPLKTYLTHQLHTFKPRQGADTALVEALNFVSPEVRHHKHHFITIAGDVGCGKTHLALGMGWRLIEVNRIRVRYWQVESLLDEIRKGFGATEGFDLRGVLVEQCLRMPLLILDDLGAEKSSEWAEAKLTEIIDHRYVNGQQTIFTTNKKPGELPPRIDSRIREGVVAKMACDDYRKVIARERRTDVRC